ncbi:MAG: PTS IIA-like nitrogen regulatory protein PtsN [Pseudomonadales bacterium]|nr:PTS IIA-like nitrogen regulatory protein PtsN [Pseudomonadales bacterium]
MHIEQFLSPECTLAGVQGGSKKRLFETIAKLVSSQHPEIDTEATYDSLLERERLGSTGLGDGVALPHCRIVNCKQIIGFLLQLTESIDFDAIDGQPVDLVFVLLVPQEAVGEHLLALQAIAEKFGQQEFRSSLRQAQNNEQLYLAATRHIGVS